MLDLLKFADPLETDRVFAPTDTRDRAASTPKETIILWWRSPWRAAAVVAPPHPLVPSNAKTAEHVSLVRRTKPRNSVFGPIPAPRNTANARITGMVPTVIYLASGVVKITIAFTVARANKMRSTDKRYTTAIAATPKPTRTVMRDAFVSTLPRNFAPRNPRRMGISFVPIRER